jgi:glycine/D-amino acid oxidase-like deaminating enzyme
VRATLRLAAMDVVVVGGGIIGLSVAHALAERGAGRVAVLERGACGQGSTSRATGGIRCQFGTEVNVRLSLRSLEAFRRWADRFGGDAGYRPVGYAFLAATAAQLDALRAAAALQRRLGARVEVWRPADLRRHLPGLALDGIVGGTFGPDDGLGDPGTAVNSLLAACRRRGVDVREGTAVEAIAVTAGRVVGVSAGTGRLPADVVVVAAGAWSAPVARLAGVELPIVPRHRQAYRAGSAPGIRRPSPLTVDMGTGVYFHTDGDGLVFGGGDRDSPPGFDERVWPEDAPRTIELLTRRLPQLRDAPLTGCWAGLREMTPDDVGVLGPLEGVGGLFVAAGFSGHGFMHAPAAGEIAADLLTGAAPPFDVSALSPARFSSDEPTSDGPSHEGIAF